MLSGKVFEYLAAERPILAVVPPDGAAARLIRETGAGVVVAPEDVAGIRDALIGLHRRWKARRPRRHAARRGHEGAAVSRRTRSPSSRSCSWSLGS